MSSPLELQREMRARAEATRSAFESLAGWEKEAHQKDEAVREGKVALTKERVLPPPRDQAPLPVSPSSARGPSDKEAKNKKKKEKEAVKGSSRFLDQKERGNAYFKRGDYASAVVHYNECVLEEKDNAVGYSNRAMALLKLGRHAEAERDCTAALGIAPRGVKVLFRRATARLALGRAAEAVQDLEAALEEDPGNKAARTLLRKARQEAAKQEAEEKKATAAAAAAASSAAPRRRLAIQEVSDDDSSEEEEEKEDRLQGGRTLVTEIGDAPGHGDDLERSASPGAPPPTPASTPVVVARQAGAARLGGAVAGTAPPPARQSATPANTPVVSERRSPSAPLPDPDAPGPFEVGYKSVRGSPEALGAYLHRIEPPARADQVLCTLMDGDLLCGVFAALRATLTDGNARRTAELVAGVAATPRLSLAVMMADSRGDIDGLFDDLAMRGAPVDAAVRSAFE